MPPATKKSRTDKRDRNGKFQEKVKYRQTTLLKKWQTASGKPGTLQRNAETLSKQTGVHVYIKLFNPQTNKMEEFKTQNMIEFEREKHQERQQQLEQ